MCASAVPSPISVMLPTMRAEKSVNESSGYWVFAVGGAGVFPAESPSFFGACSFGACSGGTCSAGGCACIRTARLPIKRMTLINRTISFSPTETRLDDGINTTEKSHAVNRRGSTKTIQGQLLLVERLCCGGADERGLLRSALCRCAQLGREVAVVEEVVGTAKATVVNCPAIVIEQPAGFILGYPIDLAARVRLVLGIESVVGHVSDVAHNGCSAAGRDVLVEPNHDAIGRKTANGGQVVRAHGIRRADVNNFVVAILDAVKAQKPEAEALPESSATTKNEESDYRQAFQFQRIFLLEVVVKVFEGYTDSSAVHLYEEKRIGPHRLRKLSAFRT